MDAGKIITFGGPYSNHIAATALACKIAGLSASGFIRSYQPLETPTLTSASALGMQFSFQEPRLYDALKSNFQPTPNQYLIPEGGYGALGVKGAASIWQHIPQDSYTHIICMVGSGTTLAGLMNGAPEKTQVIGISSMKNNTSLQQEIAALLPAELDSRIQLIHEYHFGRFAKHTPELIAFMTDLWNKDQLPSDIVYTSKLFYAVHDLIQKDYFPPQSKLLLIHTGGLQGNASLPAGTLPF